MIGTAYHQLLNAVYTVAAQHIGDHRYRVKANTAAHFCSRVAWSCLTDIQLKMRSSMTVELINAGHKCKRLQYRLRIQARS